MARQRLHERLDRLTTAQITQVLGPMGAGKTSLLASWAADAGVLWVSAGHHHRLLDGLLDHHGVAPVAGDDDGAVAALENLPATRIAATVVVDDAHYLPAEVSQLVTRLAAQAPHAARFVLLGREPVALPGLPLDVAISTLPAHELRFTDAEAEALVLSLTPTVDDDSLSRIVREGHAWAAALVVGARTVGDEAEKLARPPATGRLSAQLLAAVAAPVGTLLLATCDEESFDAATASHLTGDPDAPRLLADLAADGLLLEREPVQARGPESFRVNPVLRRALRDTSGVGDAGHETRVRAHLRAATTLVRNEAELGLAVRHAILAEDAEVLLHVLRLHGHGLLEGDGKELLAQALDALPREMRSTDPAVLVLEAMLCRMTLRYAEAADLSLAAERACEADPHHGSAEGDDLTLDMIALMRLWRSRCGWADPVASVAEARARLDCRHEALPGTHRLVSGRSLAWTTWLIGELATVEIRIGDVDEAGVHLRELIHSGHLLGHDRMLAVGLAHRSLLEMLDGSFQTAATTAESSLEYAERAGLRSRPHMALAHLVSGWGALHRLDLTGCEAHLVAAEDEVAVEVDLLVSELVRLLRARLLAEQGQVDEASRLLAEHRSVEWAIPAFARRLSLVVEAQIAALVNDVSTVRDRSLALADLGYTAEAELFAAVADAGDGRVEQALGRLGAVLDRPRLDTATGAVAAAVSVGLMLRAGDTASAAERMPDLLNRVASQRLLQILTIGFVGGEGFADLLAGQARHSAGHPFAVEALDSLARYVSVPGQGSPRMWSVVAALRSVAADVAPANGTPGGGVLTRREREVLAELANGGSYVDIAAALFVSENTVKTHLASVYRKLGVDRRGDALRIARAQHLI